MSIIVSLAHTVPYLAADLRKEEEYSKFDSTERDAWRCEQPRGRGKRGEGGER